MICTSLEAFLRSTHGEGVWSQVRRRAGLAQDAHQTMATYPDAEFMAVQRAAAQVLDRPLLSVMEDLGTWICTHPPLEAVRRLFRFTGATFVDLLISLDELDARARMAVPDLRLPAYRLTEEAEGEFLVRSTWSVPGGCSILTGILRALADEYGALAVIEMGRSTQSSAIWQEEISVRLFAEAFHAPKDFALGRAV